LSEKEQLSQQLEKTKKSAQNLVVTFNLKKKHQPKIFAFGSIF
jgi:hypothetical protein